MAVSKPPLGLTPKYIAEEIRLEEIKDAISRYYDARMGIPVEWIIEYNDKIRSQEPKPEHNYPTILTFMGKPIDYWVELEKKHGDKVQ